MGREVGLEYRQVTGHSPPVLLAQTRSMRVDGVASSDLRQWEALKIPKSSINSFHSRFSNLFIQQVSLFESLSHSSVIDCNIVYFVNSLLYLVFCFFYWTEPLEQCNLFAGHIFVCLIIDDIGILPA